MTVRKNLSILIFLILNFFCHALLAESHKHSSFLKEVKKCLKPTIEYKCKEMILITERMQMDEFYKGNLKCQTSILGLQSELIRNIYFVRDKNYFSENIIQSLIKNC